MTDGDAELLEAFLTESESNMGQFCRWLDRPLATEEALADVFRWMHTLAGSCGFFGFSNLRTVARAAENCLGILRDRRAVLDPALSAMLREAVDDIRASLRAIAASGTEPRAASPVRDRLDAWKHCSGGPS